MVNWGKPIETIPCKYNGEPVPCDFVGFDKFNRAGVYIRGDWREKEGKNQRDIGNRSVPWRYPRTGQVNMHILPNLRNVEGF